MRKGDLSLIFITVTESSPMFLNSINVEEKVKNMHYIAKNFEDCIKEVKAQHVI